MMMSILEIADEVLAKGITDSTVIVDNYFDGDGIKANGMIESYLKRIISDVLTSQYNAYRGAASHHLESNVRAYNKVIALQSYICGEEYSALCVPDPDCVGHTIGYSFYKKAIA